MNTLFRGNIVPRRSTIRVNAGIMSACRCDLAPKLIGIFPISFLSWLLLRYLEDMRTPIYEKILQFNMGQTEKVEWVILHEMLSLNQRYNQAESFPTLKRVKKLSGAIAVEVLKRELIKQGLVPSIHNVFLEKIPYELDLLILRRNREPVTNLIYNAEDVKAVLEIKYNGSYGKEMVENIKNVFDTIRSKYPSIPCVYATIWERETYKDKVTDTNLGHRAFTFFTGPGDLENANLKNKVRATGDWDRFVHFLISIK